KSIMRDIRDLGNLLGAEYSPDHREEVLRQVFGNTRLNELNKKVLIPTFDLNPTTPADQPVVWKPKFFHNYPGPDSDGDETVVDVAMRTSAAPTFFPSYQGFIDGGVVSNNPSMAALAQALDAGTGNQPLNGIKLLSIGTGFNPVHIDGDVDWGIAQ